MMLLGALMLLVLWRVDHETACIEIDEIKAEYDRLFIMTRPAQEVG